MLITQGILCVKFIYLCALQVAYMCTAFIRCMSCMAPSTTASIKRKLLSVQDELGVIALDVLLRYVVLRVITELPSTQLF